MNLDPEKLARIEAIQERNRVERLNKLYPSFWRVLQEKALIALVILGIGLAVVSLLIYPWQKRNKPTPATVAPAAVANNPFDGGVSQVKRWIERNAKDPNSIEYVEWSPVTKQEAGFLVRVKYRGKNSFGAYNIEERIFVIDSDGRVISSVPKGQ